MRVSNSKIKTWRRCPNRYRYRYVMGLRPRQKAVALERGSWLHELLMTYYDGEDWQACHKRLTKEFYNLFEEEREELGDLPTECLRIMKSYIRHYRDDFDRYHVIDSEVNEIVKLPNGLELNIIVDLIVEDQLEGGLWAWDHKTRKNFSDVDSMLLDPQLTVYYWGLEQLGYTGMKGAVYNEIRTKAPVIPEVLKSGELSKRKNIDTDVYTYAFEVKRLGLDLAEYSDILGHIAVTQKDKFFKRTHLPKDPPVLKTMIHELVESANEMMEAERKDRFPRTFDLSCKWGCDYTDICITELHGGDIEPMVKMNFDRKPADV